MAIFTKIIAIIGLAASLLGTAHADVAHERAILNSIRIMEYLHSVRHTELPNVLAAIEGGKFKPLAPEQPVWIVEILGGSILYYQGQPEFKNQPANRLVDDAGVRFGERALAFGRASKSGWIRISLGDKSYQAYCKSQYPMVVCSLAI